MPRHIYDVTIDGQNYEVDSDHPLSDREAYEHAKGQHEQDIVSDPVAQRARIQQQNETMRANMAEQADAGKPEAQFTLGKMAERGLQGAKGEAEGFGSGMVAAPVLTYQALRHPLDTLDAVGQTGAALGGAAYNAVTDPAGTYESAKNAALRFGGNPEAIGGAAGALGAAIATHRLYKLGKGTKVGQAVSAGVSDAANRIPGVKAARAVLKVTPAPVKKATVAETRAAEEAARLAAAGVVPTSDAAAANPVAAALPKRPSIVQPFAPVSNIDAGVVVPTSDAAAVAGRVTPRSLEAAREAVQQPFAPVSNIDAGLVTPTADAAAAAGKVTPRSLEGLRESYSAAPGPAEFSDPHAYVPEQTTPIGDAASSNPDLAARLKARLPYLQSPEQPLPSSMVVPTSQAEASFPAAEMRSSNAYGTPGPPANLEPPDVHGIDPGSFEVVDPDASPLSTNGSGTNPGGGSLEEVRRAESMANKGQRFAVKRGGVVQTDIKPVDYKPRPGEVFGIVDADGAFSPLDYGSAKEAMLGNRGSSAAINLTKPDRDALFEALRARMAQ